MAKKTNWKEAGNVLEAEQEQKEAKRVAASADPYKVILYPLSTEKSIRQIEFENKLAFVIGRQAKKQEVKEAVEKMFKVKVAKVNIQNSFTGKKVAYVKLAPSSLASDVSADLGLI